MKYCMGYKYGRDLTGVNEILVKYDRSNYQIKEYIEENAKDGVVIVLMCDFENLSENDELPALLQKQYPTLKLRAEDVTAAERLKGTSFFCKQTICDWDSLFTMIEWYGADLSDMYIGGELGFEIELVSRYLHGLGIEVRCTPNEATKTNNLGVRDYRSFFIRPNDLHLYDEFIDVVEFMSTYGDPEVLFEIYTKDKKWNGPLNQVIANTNIKVNNKNILPIFGIKRVSCGRKCLHGKKCEMCPKVLHLAETMSGNGLEFEEM